MKDFDNSFRKVAKMRVSKVAKSGFAAVAAVPAPPLYIIIYSANGTIRLRRLRRGLYLRNPIQKRFAADLHPAATAAKAAKAAKPDFATFDTLILAIFLKLCADSFKKHLPNRPPK